MKAAARYAIGLRGYLRRPLSGDDCRRAVERQLASRGEWLIHILDRAVYANLRSPYRRLLDHAGVELGDVAGMVRDDGVEATLGRLHAAGVRVTLDELKGLQPIRRPGLELEVAASDFDNPLLTRHFEARTSGSAGAGTRLHIELDLLAHEAAYHRLFLSAFGLEGRPYGLWRPVPPAHAGLKTILRQAKLGRGTQRWYSHNAPSLRPSTLKYRLFTAYTLAGCRLWAEQQPRPKHVPLADAGRVANWLAGKSAQGAPALLDTTWSSGVRVCKAALREGLDIGGTFFRLGGESATEARAQVIAGTGSRLAAHYSMGEVGHIGMACAAPRHLGEVHVVDDKVALIERPAAAVGGEPIESLHLTTLLPSCPKLLLNADTGDCGVLERRRCGCEMEAAGFGVHLHGIASYEKLTSEGMSFPAGELTALLDEVLPSRFGGGPGDYQLVEEDEAALPRVSLLVDPAVGDLDEEHLISVALEALSAAGHAQRMMAEHWRQGGTLRVVRRPPYAARGAKVLPLHRARASAG